MRHCNYFEMQLAFKPHSYRPVAKPLPTNMCAHTCIHVCAYMYVHTYIHTYLYMWRMYMNMHEFLCFVQAFRSQPLPWPTCGPHKPAEVLLLNWATTPSALPMSLPSRSTCWTSCLLLHTSFLSVSGCPAGRNWPDGRSIHCTYMYIHISWRSSSSAFSLPLPCLHVCTFLASVYTYVALCIFCWK